MNVAENVMAAIDNYRHACEDAISAANVKEAIQHREHMHRMLKIEIRSYAMDCEINALKRTLERMRG